MDEVDKVDKVDRVDEVDKVDKLDGPLPSMDVLVQIFRAHARPGDIDGWVPGIQAVVEALWAEVSVREKEIARKEKGGTQRREGAEVVDRVSQLRGLIGDVVLQNPHCTGLTEAERARRYNYLYCEMYSRNGRGWA